MMDTNKILILSMNNFFDSMINKIPNVFKILHPNTIKGNKLLIQGIVATPWTTLTSEIIHQFPNLKIISCFGTGIDSIDIDAAKSKNIIITNTPDIVTEDTADIAVTLLLCLSRKIILNDQFVRSGKWKTSPPTVGNSPHGKVIGIIGLGKIGKRIAEKATQFGLSILYFGRKSQKVPYKYYDNLIHMAEKCNYLIVSCPGGEETKNIVNLNILKALGKKNYLINISRGSTINENDLIYALQNNIIAGAGLDVYQNEPHVPYQLINMPNVILLPHIGTATEETRNIMLKMVFDNIISYFMTGRALNPVTL